MEEVKGRITRGNHEKYMSALHPLMDAISKLPDTGKYYHALKAPHNQHTVNLRVSKRGGASGDITECELITPGKKVTEKAVRISETLGLPIIMETTILRFDSGKHILEGTGQRKWLSRFGEYIIGWDKSIQKMAPSEYKEFTDIMASILIPYAESLSRH